MLERRSPLAWDEIVFLIHFLVHPVLPQGYTRMDCSSRIGVRDGQRVREKGIAGAGVFIWRWIKHRRDSLFSVLFLRQEGI